MPYSGPDTNQKLLLFWFIIFTINQLLNQNGQTLYPISDLIFVNGSKNHTIGTAYSCFETQRKIKLLGYLKCSYQSHVNRSLYLISERLVLRVEILANKFFMPYYTILAINLVYTFWDYIRENTSPPLPSTPPPPKHVHSICSPSDFLIVTSPPYN